MGDTTNISYADSTASPWIGCTKVTEGCANCYADEMDRKRYSRTLGAATKEHPIRHFGKGAPRWRSQSFEANVRKWNREAAKTIIGLPPNGAASRRPRIFPSLCDWLDDEVPIEWLADFLKVIHETPNLDWLLLTKRPELFWERIRKVVCWTQDRIGFGKACSLGWNWCGAPPGNPPSNVWFGVTVENQKAADERIPLLLQIPARVRWVSAEPLLDWADLKLRDEASDCADVSDCIQWVVVGGESGPHRRDCGVDAIVNVAEQCKAASVPCWVKQDCSPKPGQQGRIPDAIWRVKKLPVIF